MAEYGASEDSIIKLAAGAREIKIGYFRTIYKGIKYGSDQLGVKYLHNGNYLLTVCDKDEGLVLITITRKSRGQVKYR